MPFSSLVSHVTWWGRSPCWFRLKNLKLIPKWQGSSSSFGDIYRYVFVRFMSLCKSVRFIHRQGKWPRMFASSELSVTWHACALVLVCVFCELNPRTVPQLSLNKFRTPLCYHGLVLWLNVSNFFCSLGTSNGACVEQTQSTNGSHRHNYITENCGQCWPILDTCFYACIFLCVLFFRCIRWCNITHQISCTVTW